MSIPYSAERRSEAQGTTDAASTTTQGVKRKRDISDVGCRASETAPKHTAPKPTFPKKPKVPKPTTQKRTALQPTVPSTPKRLKSFKTKETEGTEPDSNTETIYIDWNIDHLSTQPRLTPQESAHFDKQMMPPPGIAASATPKRKRPKMHHAYYEEWNPPSPTSFLAVARNKVLLDRHNTERAPWLPIPAEVAGGERGGLKIVEPYESWYAESQTCDVSKAGTKSLDDVAAHTTQPETSLSAAKALPGPQGSQRCKRLDWLMSERSWICMKFTME